MANLNQVFLMGRLTSDPELRYTANGSAVTDLRLAINRQWKTDSGDQREDTAFIDATTWNRLAENCCQYLRKGSRVLVEGRLKQEQWEDRNSGERRSKIKVEAESVQFLDPPKGDRDDAPPQRRGQWGGGNGNGRPPARQPAPASNRAYDPPPGKDDEDIPF